MKQAQELMARVARVRQQAREREQAQQDQTEQAQREAAPAPGSNVVRLPLWPEATRGVPNVALRSALFGAIRKGARPYLEMAEIHAQDGITIRYTGTRLDQGDLDVWETVLHLTRAQPLGESCRVTAYQLLKLLGKVDTGGNREVLHRRLSRLKATALEVDFGNLSYIGGLIDEVAKEKTSREYVIRLNPKLRVLFEDEEFTQLDWTVRQALEGKPLAQWLHAFYASHAKPYPVRVETLHKLCGSETAELWKFAQTLRKNLDAVTEASNVHGQPFSYVIAGDLVHVEKTPSGTQRRYLAKKAKGST
jgi:hypothetical protein